MVKIDKQTWKQNYFKKLTNLLTEYPKILIVTVDNVGSKQMQQIRMALRGRAEVLLGKNTMIRCCLRGMVEEHPQLAPLIEFVRGNIGFVFTKGDLSDVKKDVSKFKVAAPAKAGAMAPVDVYIDPKNTGMGPEKTSFFQALNIPTKITKGTIEILNRIHICKAGDRVGASEAALLNMLAVSPFSYGLIPHMVYDEGAVYNASVLDLSQDDIRARFAKGCARVAALSLAMGYPTAVSAPHSLANGLKNLFAVAVMTDISFPAVEKTKAYLANPSAFAAAAPAAAAAAPAAAAGKPAAAAAPEPEEEEADMGFDLFG